MAKIIGIDLGTSNSAAAVLEGGKPVIIPSAVWKLRGIHRAISASMNRGKRYLSPGTTSSWKLPPILRCGRRWPTRSKTFWPAWIRSQGLMSVWFCPVTGAFFALTGLQLFSLGIIHRIFTALEEKQVFLFTARPDVDQE